MNAADQLARDVRLAVRRVTDLDLPTDEDSARRLIAALWPHGWPESVGEAGWWRTPLGLVCARLLASERGVVTHAQAAAILAVSPGTVATLVNVRGALERADGGGVVRGSVLARLARLHATTTTGENP